MPQITGAATLIDRQLSITFIDAFGRQHSQVIRTNGATPARANALILAQKIADCSNGTYLSVSATEKATFDDSQLETAVRDESEASVEKQIVIVLMHTTNRNLNQSVIIPAYDASLLLGDGQTVDKENAQIVAVANAALTIANSDGTGSPTPVYTSWRAFTTTRRVAGTRGRKVRYLLGSMTEPVSPELPPALPGANPV